MDDARGECGDFRLFLGLVPWCSGLAYVPVKDEIAGSNPVGTASLRRVGLMRYTNPQQATQLETSA